MRRRQLLATGGLALGLGTAGCAGFLESGDGQSGRGQPPPLVENRPDAVYVPSHVEGMQLMDTASAGRYRFAMSISFPHRFWLVTGDRTRQIEPDGSTTLHLMLSVWDEQTGTVLPSSNTPVRITRDGQTTVDKRMWGMLSQNMGVHFGDNVALAGEAFDEAEGTYDVAVDFGPLDTRQLGAFAGAFGDAASVSLTLSFTSADLDAVSFQRLDDRKGQRDAVGPMDMEMLPSGQLPPPGELPGRLLGEGTTGDAHVAVVTLDSLPEGLDTDGTYLAVSPRTPYNRYPLPRMGLSASIDGAEAIPLQKATHPDLGYHYGAVVDEVPADAEVTVTVDSAPSVARHEGYETAFLDMDPVTVSP